MIVSFFSVTFILSNCLAFWLSTKLISSFLLWKIRLVHYFRILCKFSLPFSFLPKDILLYINKSFCGFYFSSREETKIIELHIQLWKEKLIYKQQKQKLRTENKISKQKMIMSANKNNHNRSACKIFMSKNNPSKMQACFFKARKSRFCYRLSSPIKPRIFFCWKLAPKTDPPTPLHLEPHPFLKSNLKFYFCPK